MNTPGKILMMLGAFIFIIGAIFTFLNKIPVFKLPGDILIRKNNFTLYIPLATGIVFSLLITFFLNIFFHIFRK